jgi:cvfA/B/C family virulence factor
MPTIQVVHWRDIPAQVKVKAGRVRATRQLSDRFQIAIDRAAMRSGLFNTDDYLNHWRTVDVPERDGEPEAVAEAVAAELEASYPDARLDELGTKGGQE